jgi:hypothetical protein
MCRRRVPTKEASRPSMSSASGLAHAKARFRTAFPPGSRKLVAARRWATLPRPPKEEWCARETLSVAERSLRFPFPRASLDRGGGHLAGWRRSLGNARASTLARRFRDRNRGAYRFQFLESPSFGRSPSSRAFLRAYVSGLGSAFYETVQPRRHLGRPKPTTRSHRQSSSAGTYPQNGRARFSIAEWVSGPKKGPGPEEEFGFPE